MPYHRDLTSTRRHYPPRRPTSSASSSENNFSDAEETTRLRTETNTSNASLTVPVPFDHGARSDASSPSSSVGYTTSASPILNSLANLRARLGGSPRPLENDSSTAGSDTEATPRPHGHHSEQEDDGDTGKIKPRKDGRLENARDMYPTRTNSLGNKYIERREAQKRETLDKPLPYPPTIRQTGFDARGYPIKVTPTASPQVPDHSYPPSSSSHKTTSSGGGGGGVSGIYGLGSDPLMGASRSSFQSLAPSYHTSTIGGHSSTSHLIPPVPSLTPSPRSPNDKQSSNLDGFQLFGTGYGAPQPGPSRPASINQSLHSPTPSWSSDQAFGVQNSWTWGQPAQNDDEEEDLYWDKRSQKTRWNGPADSTFTLGTVESKLAMGREIGGARGFAELGDPYTLPLDTSVWAHAGPEADDDLHQPSKSDFTRYKPGVRQTLTDMFSVRGIGNLGCVLVLALALTALFAIWPIAQSQVDARREREMSHSGYNMGGINASGQVPEISTGKLTLIDPDTPEDALRWKSVETGKEWDLVFSDEFNVEGRTFWPGDDAFWTAEDLHYWQTNNLEWYDPRMLTTKNGHLQITLDKIPTHNMDYTGGMMNTWNKFCYTGGYFEASISLPGTSDVYGLWPAAWTLGNLGRAGYGGTLDGMWPYSYDSCDVGTLKNQSLDGESCAFFPRFFFPLFLATTLDKELIYCTVRPSRGGIHNG